MRSLIKGATRGYLKKRLKAMVDDKEVSASLRFKAMQFLAQLDGLMMTRRERKETPLAKRAGVEVDPEAQALLERVEKANGHDWAGG